MIDAGGPGSVKKCPGWLWLTLETLKDLSEAERRTNCTLSSCRMGSTKEKKVTKEGIGSLKLDELSDVDNSHAVPRRLHTLAFIWSKWVAFADPIQQKVASLAERSRLHTL